MKPASIINCFLCAALAALFTGCVSVPPTPLGIGAATPVYNAYRPAPISYVDSALDAYLGVLSQYQSTPVNGYGTTYRVRPDYVDGYRISDEHGNTTRVRPDYAGGYRATDPNGNTTRIREDYSGGWRATHSDGTVTRARPDYSGGYRITGEDGNTIRLRPDYLGGYRGYDDQGNSYRIKSPGY